MGILKQENNINTIVMALDLKEIQELIKFVAKSGASEVELEFGEMKISIKTPPKKGRGETQVETIVQQFLMKRQNTLRSSRP